MNNIRELAKIAKDIINDCKTFCEISDELDSFINNLAISKINEIINN